MAQRSQTIALILGVALLLAGCSQSPKRCAACNREECKGLAFQVTLQNGKTVETCCPRCGLHYLASTKQQAKTLQATDVVSGQRVDARKAVYVEGSDVSHCAPLEVRRDAFGCCYYKGFDRCSPSLIAFASEESAQAFQKQHGGKIIVFEKLSVD